MQQSLIGMLDTDCGNSTAFLIEVFHNTAGNTPRAIAVANCFLRDLSIIICDEEQEYKRMDSKIAKALLSLSRRRERLEQAASP
ncbi:unnamed protein product [Fusarium graminearum]|nr:hypothetical protein FG05_35181 [Fusarium graminearum]CZS73669.1 unnamed protein product [Fusarium graminearum]